jgi:hypothetical protein
MSVNRSTFAFLCLLLFGSTKAIEYSEGTDEEEMTVKNHLAKNSFVRLGKWYYLSIELPILTLLIILLMVLGLLAKCRKNKANSKPYLDFDGFFFLSFYFPLSLGFCSLFRTVRTWFITSLGGQNGFK